MNENRPNNCKQNPKDGLLLRKVAGLAIGLTSVTLSVLRELFVSEGNLDDEERRLHDSDLSGELNHHTRRLDAGTDPHGWYDD